MKTPPTMSHNELLRYELQIFRQDHRDLDEAIQALQDAGRVDMLTLQRLKRRKLALKDKIARISSDLNPDIIA
ncbi:MAG: DUF465 domain-containing protein [Rhodobacteraceae bacterium]|nr:DUF465 domain-containing protein [Paracoccaceae bacterium]